MNIVEYALLLRDQASGPLYRLTRQMRGNIRASREMGRAGREAGKAMGRSFNIGAALRGGAVAGAVIAAGRAAGQLFGSSMRAALERQMTQTSFSVLAGGEGMGKALTDQLVALQRDTILGGEVFRNAQTMMSFGFDSTEVVENMRMLGDVSMGNAERLGSLTLAFSQVRAAGRLTGQDLLQFVNAGFNPLQEMSGRTGKDMATLRKEMEDGLVTFADVQQAFRDATGEGGRFNDMLGRIAETPAGKVQQFKGMWDEVKVAIGNAFMPLLSYAVELGQRLMPVIESLTGPMAQGLETVTGYFKGLVGDSGEWMGLMQGIASIGQAVWDIISYIGGIVADIVADLVEFIRSSTLLRDVFIAIGNIVRIVYGVVKYVIDAVKYLWDNVVMPILEGIEAVWRWLNGYKQKGTGQTVEVKSAPEEKKAEEETREVMRSIADNTKANAQASASAGKAITSGGQRVVNINVGKLLDSINFHTESAAQIPQDIERVVLETLSRVLVQGAANAVG